MRHHVLAYTVVTGAGGLTDGQMPAVPEQAFTISGGLNFQVPWPLSIFAAYVGGTGIQRARINTGSLRARGFPQIYPISVGQLPTPPVPVMDMRPYPIDARKEEDLRVDITTTAAINTFSALLWVTPEPINYNINNNLDLRALRFTANVTALANGWSSPGTMVLQDLIEGGIYDIYGLALQGPFIIGGRIILQGEFLRPGCLGQALLTGQQQQMFWGQTGKWGSFNTYSPPQVETFESAAGASAITGWILCAKNNSGTVTTVPTAAGTMGY